MGKLQKISKMFLASIMVFSTLSPSLAMAEESTSTYEQVIDVNDVEMSNTEYNLDLGEVEQENTLTDNESTVKTVDNLPNETRGSPTEKINAVTTNAEVSGLTLDIKSTEVTNYGDTKYVNTIFKGSGYSKSINKIPLEYTLSYSNTTTKLLNNVSVMIDINAYDSNGNLLDLSHDKDLILANSDLAKPTGASSLNSYYISQSKTITYETVFNTIATGTKVSAILNLSESFAYLPNDSTVKVTVYLKSNTSDVNIHKKDDKNSVQVLKFNPIVKNANAEGFARLGGVTISRTLPNVVPSKEVLIGYKPSSGFVAQEVPITMEALNGEEFITARYISKFKVTINAENISSVQPITSKGNPVSYDSVKNEYYYTQDIPATAKNYVNAYINNNHMLVKFKDTNGAEIPLKLSLVPLEYHNMSAKEKADLPSIVNNLTVAFNFKIKPMYNFDTASIYTNYPYTYISESLVGKNSRLNDVTGSDHNLNNPTDYDFTNSVWTIYSTDKSPQNVMVNKVKFTNADKDQLKYVTSVVTVNRDTGIRRTVATTSFGLPGTSQRADAVENYLTNSIPDNIASIEVTFSKFEKGKKMSFKVYPSYNNDMQKSTSIKHYSNFKFNMSIGGGTVSGTSEVVDNIQIEPVAYYSNSFYTSNKSASTQVTSATNVENFAVTFNFSYGTSYLPETKIKALKGYLLVPKGSTLLSSEYRNSNDSEMTVKNGFVFAGAFNDDYDKYSIVLGEGTMSTYQTGNSMRIGLNVNANAIHGKAKDVKFYTELEGLTPKLFGDISIVDTMDINGNGSVKDILSGTSTAINVLFAKELYGVQRIDTNDIVFNDNTKEIKVTNSLVNATDSTRWNMVVYNIIPKKNVTLYGANNKNAVDTVLASKVEAHAQWRIQYTTGDVSKITKANASTMQNLTWVDYTTSLDLSKVTAFRAIPVFLTEVYAQNTETFEYKLKLSPSNERMDGTRYIHNNFFYTEGNAMDYNSKLVNALESNVTKVKVNLTKSYNGLHLFTTNNNINAWDFLTFFTGNDENKLTVLQKVKTNAVNNVTYRVYDLNDNLLYTGKVSDGYALYEPELFGKYRVEVDTPNGYRLVSTTNTTNSILDFNNSGQGTFHYVFEELPLKLTVNTKTSDGALGGVTYSLYDSNGIKVETKSTDINGKAIFENLKRNTKYMVKVDSTPSGVVFEAKSYTFTTSNADVSVTHTFNKSTTTLKISSTNSVHVNFEIYDIKGTKIASSNTLTSPTYQVSTGQYLIKFPSIKDSGIVGIKPVIINVTQPTDYKVTPTTYNSGVLTVSTHLTDKVKTFEKFGTFTYTIYKDGQFYMSTVSDGTKNFTLKGLPNGKYSVEVSHPNSDMQVTQDNSVKTLSNTNKIVAFKTILSAYKVTLLVETPTDNGYADNDVIGGGSGGGKGKVPTVIIEDLEFDTIDVIKDTPKASAELEVGKYRVTVMSGTKELGTTIVNLTEKDKLVKVYFTDSKVLTQNFTEEFIEGSDEMSITSTSKENGNVEVNVKANNKVSKITEEKADIKTDIESDDEDLPKTNTQSNSLMLGIVLLMIATILGVRRKLIS